MAVDHEDTVVRIEGNQRTLSRIRRVARMLGKICDVFEAFSSPAGNP
jgi:hypothetical protein